LVWEDGTLANIARAGFTVNVFGFIFGSILLVELKREVVRVTLKPTVLSQFLLAEAIDELLMQLVG